MKDISWTFVFWLCVLLLALAFPEANASLDAPVAWWMK